MANVNQRTGRVFIYIDGVLKESMPGAKGENLGASIQRQPVESDVGPVGYFEETKAPKVTFKLAHGPAVSVKAIMAVVNGQLQFVSDSGPSYNLTGVFAMKADIDAGKPAVVDVEMGALLSTEQGASA